MKKIILLLVLLFIIFVAYNRQRLYLRDPFGGVTRGTQETGNKEKGAQVFINYSNDVLVENDNAPAYLLVVQRDNHIGTPVQLKCIHWLVCLADADPVPLLLPLQGAVVETMTNKLVTYRTRKEFVAIALR